MSYSVSRTLVSASAYIDDQLKTILPALALLVGQVTLTQAHDFVNHWNVNGEDRVAFDPFSPGKLTAQRATNNAMLGT